MTDGFDRQVAVKYLPPSGATSKCEISYNEKYDFYVKTDGTIVQSSTTDPHEVEITTKDYTADFTFGDLIVYGKAGVRDADLELPIVHETNADIKLEDLSERVLFKGKIDDNGDIVDGAKNRRDCSGRRNVNNPRFFGRHTISEIGGGSRTHSICQRRCKTNDIGQGTFAPQLWHIMVNDQNSDFWQGSALEGAARSSGTTQSWLVFQSNRIEGKPDVLRCKKSRF